ncbi:chromate efflux transporter [Alcanivorax quisquiliarum]|uniref:Chromate efflux transporter n=1 Tax=Alcanivorax quisquiliarum TaxID=2933565 RepID=A0ABT0E523_9GAMM|nr:chromate efflux transporter [Alcanivorax quisquiliarum]MCK0536933.1 chromate efflux transporter [Alcanivorax quisquiliarum]
MRPVSFREAAAVWWRVALLSFGGPAGQIAVMHRILVEEKRWVDEQRFLHALNFCMVLPGPEAQQLATYLGWYLHGIRGGLVAGTLFILPGFISILALSLLYAGMREIPAVAALLFGLKAAVLALVAMAVWRLAQRALATPLLRIIALVALLAIGWLKLPFPLVLLLAAVIGLFAARFESTLLGHGWQPASQATVAASGHRHLLRIVPPALLLWGAPVLCCMVWLGPDHVLVTLGLFFSEVAVVTFGGAYAVLAYITQQAVAVQGWMQPGEMLDGLGLAESTPGPLIQVVQFVGFMAAFREAAPFSPWTAGVLGALMTTWVIFVPCFLFIFAGAPYVERLRSNLLLAGALRCITAAVLGVMAHLAFWFATHVLFAETRRLAGLTVPVLGSVQWLPLGLGVLALWLLGRRGWGILPVLALTTLGGGVAWWLLY